MKNPNYTREIVDDYCVIDTETTGLLRHDEIIEIGLLRIRKNKIVARYSQLIKPSFAISEFVTDLTGISNEMVKDKPDIMSVRKEVLDFIGKDIILGHNTSFDVRFLNQAFKCEISNFYIDTLQFSRRLYPELKHHRLSDLVTYLSLKNNEHRALADCISTKELYDAIKELMAKKGLTVKELWPNKKHRLAISSIKPQNVIENQDHLFFNKHVVFTGKLERMVRQDAMQIVVNLGGKLDNSVNHKTNFLILGDNTYNAILKGEKSSKHLKAEKLKLEGQDIEIIDEYTFYDILEME